MKREGSTWWEIKKHNGLKNSEWAKIIRGQGLWILSDVATFGDSVTGQGLNKTILSSIIMSGVPGLICMWIWRHESEGNGAYAMYQD